MFQPMKDYMASFYHFYPKYRVEIELYPMIKYPLISQIPETNLNTNLKGSLQRKKFSLII